MKRRTFNTVERKTILTRDEELCAYCGKPANGIDHVIPLSKGGITSTANGVCCCPKCNYSKHAKLDEVWIVKGLQRLIQHGEDVSWIGGIRYEPIAPIYQFAIDRLYGDGLSVAEISCILQIDVDVIQEHLEI